VRAERNGVNRRRSIHVFELVLRLKQNLQFRSPPAEKAPSTKRAWSTISLEVAPAWSQKASSSATWVSTLRRRSAAPQARTAQPIRIRADTRQPPRPRSVEEFRSDPRPGSNAAQLRGLAGVGLNLQFAGSTWFCLNVGGGTPCGCKTGHQIGPRHRARGPAPVHG